MSNEDRVAKRRAFYERFKIIPAFKGIELERAEEVLRQWKGLVDGA
jgi:hypothetical protein